MHWEQTELKSSCCVTSDVNLHWRRTCTTGLIERLHVKVISTQSETLICTLFAPTRHCRPRGSKLLTHRDLEEVVEENPSSTHSTEQSVSGVSKKVSAEFVIVVLQCNWKGETERAWVRDSRTCIVLSSVHRESSLASVKLLTHNGKDRKDEETCETSRLAPKWHIILTKLWVPTTRCNTIRQWKENEDTILWDKQQVEVQPHSIKRKKKPTNCARRRPAHNQHD